MDDPARGKGKRRSSNASGKAETTGLTKLYKLRFLQKMIANGWSVFELEDHCMTEWRMSARNARRYTAEAYQSLADNYEGLDKRAIAFVLFSRLEKSFAIARLERNAAAMVAACKELADRFYKLAPDGISAGGAQPQEEGAGGLNPEEDF